MSAEKSQYIEAVGRRKTAIARVRMTPASKQSIRVNEKEMADYFKTSDLQRMALESIEKAGVAQKFAITAKIMGGGINSQAESVRLGVARCLEKFDPTLRAILKKEGFLTRDQRAVERKKPGLKKARKRPTWSKR